MSYQERFGKSKGDEEGKESIVMNRRWSLEVMSEDEVVVRKRDL